MTEPDKSGGGNRVATAILSGKLPIDATPLELMEIRRLAPSESETRKNALIALTTAAGDFKAWDTALYHALVRDHEAQDITAKKATEAAESVYHLKSLSVHATPEQQDLILERLKEMLESAIYAECEGFLSDSHPLISTQLMSRMEELASNDSERLRLCQKLVLPKSVELRELKKRLLDALSKSSSLGLQKWFEVYSETSDLNNGLRTVAWDQMQKIQAGASGTA
jgi:hypothetical protein